MVEETTTVQTLQLTSRDKGVLFGEFDSSRSRNANNGVIKNTNKMRQTKKEMLSGIEEQVEKSKLIKTNVVHIWYKNGTTAIRYHLTDIISEQDGIVTLSSGGWKTNTTKDNINRYNHTLGKYPRLFQKNHQWFIGEGIFYDGMQFKDGVQISVVKIDDELERKKMLSKINKYCALITEDNLPQPSNGDCFDCLKIKGHRLDSGSGGVFNDQNHLVLHMEEKYVVGSLLVNAMREEGYRDVQIKFQYMYKMADTFKRAVRKYLIKRLIK